MSLHVLARRGCDSLEAIVFHVGDSGTQEAVVVFTNPQAALKYLRDAGWDAAEEIRTLSPRQALPWLLQAAQQGIQHVFVNPVRGGQDAGSLQPALAIESLLSDAGERLAEAFHEPLPPGPVDLETVSIYHCMACGKIRRQPRHQRQPRCCGELMAKAAEDSATRRLAANADVSSASS